MIDNDLIGSTQFLISESRIYTNEVGVVSNYSVIFFICVLTDSLRWLSFTEEVTF